MKQVEQNTAAVRHRTPRTFGDLGPVEDAAQRLRGILDTLREAKPGPDDDYMRGLAAALSILTPALVEGQTAKLRITPRQRAEIEGVALDALYKRVSRACKRGETVPGLVREGRSIFFELNIPAPAEN